MAGYAAPGVGAACLMEREWLVQLASISAWAQQMGHPRPSLVFRVGRRDRSWSRSDQPSHGVLDRLLCAGGKKRGAGYDDERILTASNCKQCCSSSEAVG